MDLSFRLINAFAASDDPFSGNAICVFDDAAGLDADQMSRLAQQMNIECAFLIETSSSAATIAIEVPLSDMKLSASSIIGAAHVISQMHQTREEMVITVGDTQIKARPEGKDNWTIPAAPATTRKLKSTPQILSSLVGLQMSAISGEVMVVESTRSGVVLPVASPEDVRRTRLDARMLHSYAMLLNTEPQIYVWSKREDGSIESRMFYGPGGGVIEVAATGSGAANLGAWLAVHGEFGRRRIYQGAAVGRPSMVDLEVKESGQVLVGGHINQVAAGTFTL
ncbi:MAG: PhzF family phenazine biosynthesis protein [Austwickia sp.]|jgi:trans-2,3-dihydro-3-hydroxyanthranilate isomerase|nr:PhzF family phenazine biosynthesis protein [Austwickia sp.]MBK8437622.1 PhzF family phenazine biosynthesis protein [Austwickia sp.]MBK9102930.1 PhzF family phenazine biosynthesis protein [Austwickia sp.]